MKMLIPPLSAILGMFGTLLVIGLLNDQPPRKKRELTASPVSFSVSKPPKIQRQKTPKPKPKAKHKPPPLPMIGPSLTGLSFGIEALDDFSSIDRSDLLKQTNVVMTSETVDTPPRPKERKSPDYPHHARRKGVEGYVILSLLVDEFGGIKDAFVLESHPEGIFDQSALSGIREWRFLPGEYEGDSVSVRVTQTLRYSLN